MGNMISSDCEPSTHSLQQISHGLFPVKHASCLFIIADIVLYLPEKLLIDLLIFYNLQEDVVDLRVEDIMLGRKTIVFIFQSISL